MNKSAPDSSQEQNVHWSVVSRFLGHFRPYENPVTDVFQQLLSKKPTDIVLLFITEKEYQNGFNSISPLSRERLALIVKVLVKLGAKAIAIL